MGTSNGAVARPKLATAGSLRWNIVEGFIGAVLILIGSCGVGWLAIVSPLNRQPWLINLRTETWGVALSTILLTLGCWVLFRAWLRLRQLLSGWPEGSLRAVTLAGGIWTIPMLFCVPIFSRDVFAYIGQGRLVASGQDPYVDGISTLSNWFQLGADPRWAQSETPYGPFFLWIEYLVNQVAGTSPDTSVFLYRLVALLGVVLLAIYVPKLAALHGVEGAKAQWITVANPFLLVNFVASAHNDALMVGLAVAATYYAATKRGFLGVVLLTASIGVKLITIVLLPFIGLLWAGAGASWWKKFRYWAYTGLIVLALMTLTGILNGYGFGWLKVMLITGTGYTVFAPLGMLVMFFEGAFNALGLDSSGVLPTIKLIGRLSSVLVVLFVIFRGKHSHLVQRMGIAFAALVVLSPVIQPWYLLWILPFFAVTGIRDDWQMVFTIFTSAFMLAYGAADQIFVWQFLSDSESWIKHMSTLISWAGMAYLAFLDPHTKHMFRGVLPPLRRPKSERPTTIISRDQDS
ncbi:polyprenol phosphomannose-dependent alpha 1,6 mannosyltransferase MptB [Neomicrococcus lactis]|uniref:polyprenol phosphomannose-dependent alpha 1,6 mannosyltransferase MptB n=1 Tax=Neomicrococcus lactis TaxID=732241 RepID=UPI00230081F5|nr:polyprenol phosphomannose-dependent alpha 1,6 mannosyltransferase MptB [Neomicrococcus lactis]